MDRHALQSEVGYLFSGYGSKGERGEEQSGKEREKQKGEEE